MRRGGRAAEGPALEKQYPDTIGIVGSNPTLSAINTKDAVITTGFVALKAGFPKSNTCRTLYFRIRIPKHLQETLARKALRYSLGTGVLSDAKATARYLAGQTQLLFEKIETGPGRMKDDQ